MPEFSRRIFLAALLSGACIAADASRPFHMGFTRWPADLTPEGAAIADDFARAHGDIISIMFIGGIPWPEALDGREFSKDVEKSLRARPANGAKLFLSISPLNQDRAGLAPYWGEKENLPLPAPWDKLALNSAEVKKAYLNFTLRAIQSLKPDFLAIGIESNVLLSKNPAKWKQLKELHRETYAALKQKFPTLPVCFTTEVLHYKKLSAEARDKDHVGEVADLMKHSDIFAMSVYPFMSTDVPRPFPADFFDFATALNKPLAISESGMTSRDVELKSFKLTLRGTEPEQWRFTENVLKVAARDKYLFVINFATTDFEKLCDRLPPPMDDVGRIWAFTGMQTSAKMPKPALATWDAYLKIPFRREK